MTFFLRLFAELAARILPAQLGVDGLPPWQFGMTSQQVSGFRQHAPYFLFANGDLETYCGNYDGQQQNIQFFFDQDRLTRIGINLYEGTDPEDGRQAWKDAYRSLTKQFGRLDLTLHAAADAAVQDLELLSHAAKRDVIAGGMQQMSPARRLPGIAVYATYAAAHIKGQQYYYVIIIFDAARTT